MNPAWGLERILQTTIFVLLIVAGAVLLDLAVRLRDPGIYYTTVALAALGLILLTILYVWRRVVTTEYVVSDETVYTRRGRIILHVNSAPLDRITDLHVHTSLVGRLFGYSSLVVRTAGGGLHLAGLRDAYHVRGVVHEDRRAYIARLLGESAPKEEARLRKKAQPTDRCLCPRCGMEVPVAPERPVAVTCPRCLLQGTLFEEAIP